MNIFKIVQSCFGGKHNKSNIPQSSQKEDTNEEVSDIVLKYNGKKYYLHEGDIPLRGKGKITITNKDGHGSQSISGDFDEGLNCSQIQGVSYINGVNVNELIKKLEARRISKKCPYND